MKRLLYYILLLLVAFSCGKKSTTTTLNNYYTIKIGKAFIPVNITGAPDAEELIIYINDGISNDANTEKSYSYWQQIETKYKVLFYDQRGTGSSQGNISNDEMAIEQFASDLDVLVNFAYKIGKVKSVYLHGTGIGAAVAIYYLKNGESRTKINGFIAEAPAYNLINAYPLSKSFVLNYADTAIARNINNPFWQAVQQYYAINNGTSLAIMKQHLEYLQQTNGLVYDATSVRIRTTDQPNTNSDLIYKNQQLAFERITYNGQNLYSMDLTPELNNIDIPVLLIWGDKDGWLPKSGLLPNFVLGLNTADLVYNPAKYNTVAHYPHIEDMTIFQQDVTGFVESFKSP